LQSIEQQDPFLERAFARISESEQHPGNAVRLLKDAAENYPAWLDAIRTAETSILFENYIIADDAIGRSFAEALSERARQGVRVRLLRDWLGCLGRASSRFWSELAEAGVEIRVFNPPRIGSPLAWLRRDHRKVLVADNRIGFVSGLCVACEWQGNPAKGVEAWRDTGVELRGPVLADLVRAFADTWALTGPPLPLSELPVAEEIGAAGEVAARIIAGQPGSLITYRLDQFVASAARRSLWLTDAYFVATTAYVQALTGAARDGVDVRLLVPRTSDVPIVKPVARAGYRPLLEAGIRVFEWNGPMLHAKTAVADGIWSRIGSTNLNLASWLTNWELDVTITDRAFAERMTETYLSDLRNATEIVLDVRKAVPLAVERRRRVRSRRGSTSRFAAGAVSLGNTAGAAMMAARSLSSTEAKSVASIGFVLVALAAVAAIFPRVFVIPLILIMGWIGFGLLARAWRLRRDARERKQKAPERPALPAGPSDGGT
jgi:cardiolipin synthase